MCATRLDTIFYRRKRKVTPSTNPAMQSETKRVQLLSLMETFYGESSSLIHMWMCTRWRWVLTLYALFSSWDLPDVHLCCHHNVTECKITT